MSIIPIFSYRSLLKKPRAFALLDPEDVEKLESYAEKKLVLHFGKYGNILLQKKYFKYMDWCPYRNKITYSAYIFNLFDIQSNRYKKWKVIHLDGNPLNLIRSNLILLIYIF